MSNNEYDQGRLNLPFVGICTFGKYPYIENWDKIDADVAVLGAPFDFGSQFRSGARMGPRGIMEASTLFSFGHGGAYDHEDNITYLPSDTTKVVDLGDADIIHTDTVKSHENIKYGVKKILKAKAIPIVLGGDHSINIPCIEAFEKEKELDIWDKPFCVNGLSLWQKRETFMNSFIDLFLKTVADFDKNLLEKKKELEEFNEKSNIRKEEILKSQNE